LEQLDAEDLVAVQRGLEGEAEARPLVSKRAYLGGEAGCMVSPSVELLLVEGPCRASLVLHEGVDVRQGRRGLCGEVDGLLDEHVRFLWLLVAVHEDVGFITGLSFILFFDDEVWAFLPMALEVLVVHFHLLQMLLQLGGDHVLLKLYALFLSIGWRACPRLRYLFATLDLTDLFFFVLRLLHLSRLLRLLKVCLCHAPL